ncbi:MAG: hypothetical protein WAK21_12330 [Candidatus Sulfotelmatobacter sp.]
MKSKIWLFLITWVFLLGVDAAVARENSCDQKRAARAETEADDLKSWGSVQRFYKQFSDCDDGAIAEGVSDSVAKLLARKWNSVGDLVRFGSKDKAFESFVVRHLDETISESDASRIHQNAQSRCPSNAARLCKILVAKTTPPAKASSPRVRNQDYDTFTESRVSEGT